jgi:MurNAc alpha-1-phosphate uridylyltransferase
MRQAMILAAGRGERMRPLTDRTPKPLQCVHGKPLIVWQIEGLRSAGFTDLVINHAWLGEQVEALVGDGSQWGVRVRWSREGVALGTAGGVATALHLLTEPEFLLVSADIFTGFWGQTPPGVRPHAGSDPGWGLTPKDEAHLVLVDEPSVKTDFSLKDGRVIAAGQKALTYGNIGLFRRSFFASTVPGEKAELGPMLHQAVARGTVSGELFTGLWANVGSADDLARLNSAAIF